jgi:ATP-dependent DNA helicase PIF1
VLSPETLKEFCLIEIEIFLRENGKTLSDYECMPQLKEPKPGMFNNILLENEYQYDPDEMKSLHDEHVNNLNSDQLSAYQVIYDAVDNGLGNMFFVNGYGGTGKTFLWKTLSYRLRSEGKIVLNVASSGIASILLPGGKTAHSQFGIPLVLTKEACCKIDKKSKKAELLIMSSLIIWDEAPMINKWAFEAFERTLQDIMSEVDVVNKTLPFGGKTVVFGGDFRQILPVIPKGSRADIVHATINSSYLWRKCRVLTLNQNMRLQTSSNPEENQEIAKFAQWILDIGDGKVGVAEDGEYTVEIPQDLLINSHSNPIGDIIDEIYPKLLDNIFTPGFFQNRAILAPTLEVVEKINDYVLALFPGDSKEYLSCDSIAKCDDDVGVDCRWITTEFLNEIKCSGLPNHKLNLKIGVVIMLMRNINVSSGLCNGTRLIVNYMGTNVIGAQIVTGTNIGDVIYISRYNLIPSDANVSISFQRRQFPVCVCFGMTINKSQGQSLGYVGLYLPRTVFTHGQLYVALSRVTTRSGLRILILDDEGKPKSNTMNVVYPEVFHRIYI